MICARCGKEIKKDQLFCHNCGYEVRLVAEYDATEDLYVKPVIDFADEKTPDNDKTIKSSTNNKPYNNKNTTAGKKTILIIVTVIFLLASGFISYIVFNFNNNNSFDYQLNSAKKYYNQGRYELSIKHLKRAVELNPEVLEARLFLAELYNAEKDIDSSISAYNEAIKTDPSNEKTYDDLFKVLKDNREYYKIIEYINRSPIKDKLILKYSEFFPDKPNVSIEPGIYDDNITLILNGSENSDIYYTVNAETPTINSPKYVEPIVFDKEDDFIVKAVLINEYGVSSDVFVGNYTVSYPVPNSPVVIPSTGQYNEDTLIKIELDEGCVAYYNWNGKIPDSNSKKYNSPIKMKKGSHTFTTVSINKYGKVSSPVFRSYDVFENVEEIDNDSEIEED